MTSKFIFRSLINRPLSEVMRWHLCLNMEKRSIPPWESIQVIQSSGRPNQKGARLYIHVQFVWPISKNVILEYFNFFSEKGFETRQIKGPFVEWNYKMKLREQGQHACESIDELNFKHQFPKILAYFMNQQCKKRIVRILKYKHEVLQNDLDLLSKYAYDKPLKILMTGATGFIGGAVREFLEFAGHDVWILSHQRAISPNHKVMTWDLLASGTNVETLEGFDAAIHLAGDNISKGSWSDKKKASILESRYRGTEQLVKALAYLKYPPKTFICASAVGFYGDRGQEVLTEESPPGEGLFLTKVCQYWERAARELEEKGVRVVCTRFGMVLSSKGAH